MSTETLSSTSKITKQPRRMARATDPDAPAAPAAPVVKPPSRLDQIEALLLRLEGATIADMVAATGWQQHSVRGAMAGALRKRGLAISSEKQDGVRYYHAMRGGQ